MPSLATRHEVGSAYRQLLVLGDGTLALGRKDHMLSLFAGEDDLVHFDLEARLHRAWLGGRSFQRGLDGRVRQVSLARGEAERSRSLSIALLEPAEATRVLATVGALASRALAELPADADRELADLLARARARATPEAEQLEAERFRAAYEPIPILPPDQNRALVIQLTSGCSWNRCTFCHLYKDTSFSMKTPESLGVHVRRVLELVGRALPLRRGVFLGQANALVIGKDKLLPLLDVVRRELGPAFAPLAAFIDAFSRLPAEAELASFAERGLRGVALGLESGSAEVLTELGKPAESRDAIEVARRLHAAGIAITPIVLVGAGGQELARRHVEQTLATLVDMQLRRGDRVYLSPLVVHPDTDFSKSLLRKGALSPDEIAAQAEELRDGLRRAGVTVPIALYDLRRFVY